MKIILHIGNYKTGTSALQNFLYKNRQKLMEYGIYYGNTWKVVNNHAGLAFGILKGYIPHWDIIINKPIDYQKNETKKLLF